jgi:Na+/H+-translocating membrane pyrophosphatase
MGSKPWWVRMDGVIMSPSTKVGIVGVIVGLILLAILPWWAAVGIIIVALAIPVGGYMALDKSQRRRLRAIRARERGN